MFIFLSKFLPPLIYPLNLAVLLITLSVFVRRKVRLQRVLLILGLVILLVASNRFVATGLIRELENRISPAPEIARLSPTRLDTPVSPVIVLLGGGTESFTPPRSMVELNSAGDRVLFAVQLYRLGYGPKILVTGGNLDWSSNTQSPAEDMAALLQFLGVPNEDIWLEGESRNTYENAVYSYQLLKDKGIHQIILVTSAQHMPRSVGLFAKQGLEILPAPADYNLTEQNWQQIIHPRGVNILLNLLPSASNLEMTTGALKEYLGMLVYRLRGWMD